MIKEIKITDETLMPDLGCRDWIARFYDKMPVCVIEANVTGISSGNKKQPVRLPCFTGKGRCVIENIPDWLKKKYDVNEEDQSTKDARKLDLVVLSGLIGKDKKRGCDKYE